MAICFPSHHPQWVEEEDTLTAEQRAIKHVGKQDPKRHLEAKVGGVSCMPLF